MIQNIGYCDRTIIPGQQVSRGSLLSAVSGADGFVSDVPLVSLMNMSMADTLSMPTAAGRDPAGREDAVLVTPVSRHDYAAFERIVAEHHPRVAGLAYRLLGWADEVDDVVQDVFLKALRNLTGFEGRSRLSTWLTRITVNTCRTHRRP